MMQISSSLGSLFVWILCDLISNGSATDGGSSGSVSFGGLESQAECRKLEQSTTISVHQVHFNAFDNFQLCLECRLNVETSTSSWPTPAELYMSSLPFLISSTVTYKTVAMF